MLEFLRKTALFRGVAEDHLKYIAAFSNIETYENGGPAIIEGSPENHQDILLVVAGEVSVGTRFSSLPNALQFDLKAISNELIGEIGWILGKGRSATVNCKGYCRFIRVNGEKLHAYCKAHPELGVELLSRIAAVLAERVVNLTSQVRNRELYS